MLLLISRFEQYICVYFLRVPFSFAQIFLLRVGFSSFNFFRRRKRSKINTNYFLEYFHILSSNEEQNIAKLVDWEVTDDRLATASERLIKVKLWRRFSEDTRNALDQSKCLCESRTELNVGSVGDSIQKSFMRSCDLPTREKAISHRNLSRIFVEINFAAY